MTGVAHSATITFAPATSYAAGGNPVNVISADLNGDAKLDLLVANGAGTLSLYHGHGTGAFDPAISIATTVSPVGVAASDVDKDGDLDLVYTQPTANSFQVLRNTAGSFSPFLSAYPVGSNPLRFGVGDFNGDSWPDLAVTNKNSSNVSVAINRGDGSFFTPTITYPAGSSPRGIVPADFNADGILDLAVTDESASNIVVLNGNGDGSFGPPTPYFAVPSASGIVTRDFDNDGRADIAVVGSTTPGRVAILRNIGNSFAPAISYPVGASGSFQIASADLDQDGKLDLAVSGNVGTLVSTLRGNGDATFQPAQNIDLGVASVGIEAANLNADLKPDLAFTVPLAATLQVLLNNTDLTAPLVSSTLSPSANAAGWSRVNTSVVWSTSDPESGIASSTGCGAIVQSSETSGKTLTCTATNGSGLTTTRTVTIKLDKTVPAASITSGANAVISPLAALQGSANDPVSNSTRSGIASVTVAWTPELPTASSTSVATGCGGGASSCSWTAAAPTIPGVYTVKATATDVAGNQTTSAPVTVIVV
ncbi:MAG: FG-GAP-like repeat-containing protein [Actinomycetota bacterium]